MRRFTLWAGLLGTASLVLAAAMLRPQESALVLEQLSSPGPVSLGHAGLEARCGACHEPGVGGSAARCTACHANEERLLGRQPTMFHASVQECASCHVEHEAASARPLAMDHVELARLGIRTLERESRADGESAATLASLETWLRIRGPEELGAASARASLDCAACHDRGEPHFKRFGTDCAQCHRFESWSVPGYRHPSPDSRACVQCHQAPPSHFMEHFAMVSQRVAGKESVDADRCYECHNTTSWNDIVDVGFYKHH